MTLWKKLVVIVACVSISWATGMLASGCGGKSSAPEATATEGEANPQLPKEGESKIEMKRRLKEERAAQQ